MPAIRPIHQPQQSADSAKARLLATVMETLIADLPPTDEEFSAAERDKWVTRWRSGIDVVYGPVERAAMAGPIPVITQTSGPVGGGMANATPPTNAASDATKRFFVAPDSFILITDAKGTRGAKFADVPPGTVIWDERTAPDRGYSAESSPEWGRTDNIMWDDVGTKPDGALPAGVTMRPAVADLA